MGFVIGDKKITGFQTTHLGQTITVERPSKPTPKAWGYRPYQRDITEAYEFGLLAGSQLNREIRPQRVEEYLEEMKAGRWHDLLSDPISITADGFVLNGQHRLAAATRIEWSMEHNPAFLVIWGVHPLEAFHADGSRRTDRDEKTIAQKLVTAATASGV